jgi:hypothetical protein
VDVEITALGGAMHEIPWDQTAFPHRDGSKLLIQWGVSWTRAEQSKRLLNELNDFYVKIRPIMSSAAFLNYADRDLPNPAKAYWGSNLDRLIEVKRKYDPHNIFRLIPAAAVAALLIYFLARPIEQIAQQDTVTAERPVTAGQPVTGGSPVTTGQPVTVGQPVTTGQPSTTTAEQPANAGQSLVVGGLNIGITDAASARAALPKLQEVAAQIDKVSGLTVQLSAERRKLLAGIVTPSLPTLNQLLDKVLAIPGVAEVLKPTIDTLKAKLSVLTA